jgi:hypothetical protein
MTREELMFTAGIECFVEAEYLEMYPDVARAIEEGRLSKGLDHFILHGQQEGRAGYLFNETWYRRSYRLAVAEVTDGTATNLRSHYEEIGRHRGYIPHPIYGIPNLPREVPRLCRGGSSSLTFTAVLHGSNSQCVSKQSTGRQFQAERNKSLGDLRVGVQIW